MIIALRRSFKSKTFKVLFWITALAVSGALSVVEFARIYIFGKGGNKWALKVNNQPITSHELQRSTADQEERIRIMRAQYGQYADLYFKMMGLKLDPQELAIDALIRKSLLNQLSNALSLHASDSQAQNALNNPMMISQELSELVPFSTWDFTTGGINPVALHMYLQNNGVSTTEFNQELKAAVTRNNVKQLIEHSVYIPEFEIKEKFSQNYLGHKFTIGNITNQEILNHVKKETVSDEKLKAYYDLKNSQEKRYYVPEKRSAKIVTFDPLTYGIELSDQEIEKYYNNNKAQFIEQPAQVQVRRILFANTDPAKEREVKQQAEALRQELQKNPEQFAAKAKELSQDTKTAPMGGLMPYFKKGEHDKVFEKTAFLLPEGGISLVIKTKGGYEILQQVSKKTQTFKPLASVNKDIKNNLVQKKFNERFSSDVRSILNQQNSEEALKKFIQEKHGKETIAKDLVSDNSIQAKTVFRLKEHETSYYQEPQKGVLATVTQIKKSYAPAIEEIKNSVKEDYYKEQASKALASRLEEIKKNPSLFETHKNSMKVEKTDWMGHSNDRTEGKEEKSKLQKLGIDLDSIFQIENKGGIKTQEHNGNGYIIRLDEIEPFNKSLYTEKKESLYAQLQQQRKPLMLAGFVASLYRNATINKNDSLIHKES